MIDFQNPVTVDILLNKILNCRDQWEFAQFAVREYAPNPDGDSYQLLLRWLKRRAIMRSEYQGSSGIREIRNGKPWSWAEEMIMKWAFVQSSSEKKKVTEAKIAVLLQRTVEEVKEKRKTRNGIRGFDL